MSAPVEKEARAAQARIAADLARIGFVLPGTITERMRRCGKPNCHCAKDPDALHGPYIQWARYRPWFDDAHQLRELLSRLEALSLEAISQTEGWGPKADREVRNAGLSVGKTFSFQQYSLDWASLSSSVVELSGCKQRPHQ